MPHGSKDQRQQISKYFTLYLAGAVKILTGPVNKITH